MPKVVFVLMIAFTPDPTIDPSPVLVYRTQDECLAAAKVKTGADEHFRSFCVEYSTDYEERRDHHL